jgi:hypothetical protein
LVTHVRLRALTSMQLNYFSSLVYGLWFGNVRTDALEEITCFGP